jgi:hypothetical protein
MEKELYEECLKVLNTNPKFRFINATDIAKQVGSIYFGVKKTDRKNASRYVSSFIYLITMIEGWEKEYSNRYIAACCGLKYTTQVSYYRSRHKQFLNDDRYKLRLVNAITKLNRLEQRKQNRFKKYNGIYNDKD